MKVAIHLPYGSLSQESGLLTLLARYLHYAEVEVVLLGCNGFVSQCKRDLEFDLNGAVGGVTDSPRGLHSCLACMRDQRALAEWGEVPRQSLGRYLRPQDIDSASAALRWACAAELYALELNGVRLYEACEAWVRSRLGVDLSQEDVRDTADETCLPELRRVLFDTAAACLAVQRFNNHFEPDVSITIGGEDYLSRALALQTTRMQLDIACFKWSFAKRSVLISRSHTEEVLQCDLVIDSVHSMRSDVRTWPSELLRILENVSAFCVTGELVSAKRQQSAG